MGILLAYSFILLKKRFIEFFQLIPQYLLVSLLIFVISLVSHGTNFFFGANDKDLFAGIINSYTGSFFVVFTGFFAFSQWKLSRFENLREEALGKLRDKPQPSYLRARKLYEEAHSIKKDDFTVSANLAELYLILKDFDAFDNLANRLGKVCVEDKEIVIRKFLLTAKWLIQEDLGSMKKPLNDLIKFCIKKEQILGPYIWSFQDLRSSETYKSLSEEPKEVLNNSMRLVEKTLENDKRKEFITKFQLR